MCLRQELAEAPPLEITVVPLRVTLHHVTSESHCVAYENRLEVERRKCQQRGLGKCQAYFWTLGELNLRSRCSCTLSMLLDTFGNSTIATPVNTALVKNIRVVFSSDPQSII